MVGDQGANHMVSGLRLSRPITRIPTPQSCTMASSRSQGDLTQPSSNSNTRRYNLSESTPKRATPRRCNSIRNTSDRTIITYNTPSDTTPSDTNNSVQSLKHAVSCPDHIQLHEWQCHKCTVKNEGGVDKCTMCGEFRPVMQRRLTRTTLGPIESSELQTTPSWICPSCQVTNSNRSENCTLCGLDRSLPLSSSSTSDWYCNRCSTHNHFSKCSKCYSAKPNNTPIPLTRARSVSSPVPSAQVAPATNPPRTNMSGSNPPGLSRTNPTNPTISRTPTPRGLNCNNNVAVEPNTNRTTMKRKIVPMNEANIQLKYT